MELLVWVQVLGKQMERGSSMGRGRGREKVLLLGQAALWMTQSLMVVWKWVEVWMKMD